MKNITPAFLKEVYEKATLLFSKEELKAALDKMAAKMELELKEQNPVMLTVMNGGLITASELALRLNFPMQMDYIHATRYTGETTGGASVHWKKEPSLDLENRSVIIVDDILDGGLTLSAIVEYCEGRGAKRVYTAVLLDKTEARHAGALEKADFTALEVANDYVFGYGLDYHEYLRNYPEIYKVAKEHM
ncbi:MAG: hypoxanthine-guanine phosphoribosyltransferase [Gammaproteobacteria bacterium]|nr:hypoxanthine-guanine phosphoribosyltransferase [Gammaproteobacteria bacterium]